MDIENLHPFCLPFGLCHDATSSSIATDGGGGSTSAGGTLSSSPLSPSSKEIRLSSQRSKNSSPSDELFRQLNNTISSTTILGQSLLNHHDLIIGDGSFYSPLDDDIMKDDDDHQNGDDEENRLRKSSIATDIDAFTDSDHKLEEEEEESEETIDWYYGEYSLFSPTRRKSLSASAKAAIRATNLFHHQVFQHLVDPIDIKSSPTLAQLNLNSNDNDPMDGFWDSGTTTTSTSISSTNQSSLTSRGGPTNHTDLLSNCTSINKNSLTAGTCCSRTLSTNHHHHHHHHTSNHNHQHHLQTLHNHQHQQHSGSSDSINPICNNQQNLHQQTQQNHTHHQQQQQQHLLSAYSSTAHLTSCPHHHQQQLQLNHQQPYQQQHQNDQPSTMQSPTCLGQVAAKQDHHPFACCQHNLASTNPSNGTNLMPSSTFNELNRQQPPNALSTPQLCSELDPKKRPPSPALVTSSSSPLSSLIASTPGQQPQQKQQQQSFASSNSNPQAGGDNNNKLKENIEYLTALLCNGNKLENNNQQPSSISSSMARSYSTLAHTLSTGPKLLERPLQPTEMTNTNQTSSSMIQNQPTNEAAPCLDANGLMKRPQRQQLMQPQPQPQPQQQQQIQQHHNHQWVKVESSISAADSTESQTMPYAMQAGQDCPTASNQCQQQQQQQQRAPDMRVLSSLLTSGCPPVNKCAQGCANHHVATISTSSPWPPVHHQQLDQQQQEQQQQAGPQPQITCVDPVLMPSADGQQRSSIPPNGRPITLTPIASHNNPILQQQQLAARVKSSPFIQPASPSASSTASSGANTDVGSSGSGPTIKKPRLAQSSGGSNKSSSSSANKSSTSSSGSNRSGRPNSLSTECSLSSHDEGFSSQIDNDDCNSNRDSDEEDEVDSDDESFYGDYTNSDLIGASISDDAENKWTLNMGRTRRNGQKRYFWQYNVQSKGPKGTRICSADDSGNPFVLPEASDPVFSNDCQVEGVKHSGKARRGDGNDLTPNPRKLLMIGLELKKLGKIINELAPVTDLPINARTKTRKEKNKLASRACRFKKKAQHEANKIKLYGLQREHQQAVLAIYDVRKLLNQKLAQKDNGVAGCTGAADIAPASLLQRQSSSNSEQLQPPTTATLSENSSQLMTATGGDTENTDNNNTIQLVTTGATNASVVSIAEQCSMRVAGQTSDFVNSVLEKVVSGFIDGGLET